MVDFITPVAGVNATVPAATAPVATRSAAVAQTGGAAGFGPAATLGAEARPDGPQVVRKEGPAPLRLSIDRADDGVFVYTLKDPQTGALVAVIPRAEFADTQGAGRTVDRKV